MLRWAVENYDTVLIASLARRLCIDMSADLGPGYPGLVAVNGREMTRWRRFRARVAASIAPKPSSLSMTLKASRKSAFRSVGWKDVLPEMDALLRVLSIRKRRDLHDADNGAHRLLGNRSYRHDTVRLL